MSLATSKSEIPLEDIYASADKFTHWNYQVPDLLDHATGYEDVDSELRRYSSIDFQKADDAGKRAIISFVADIYESKGIFPIRYFSEKGAYNEITKCIDFTAKFDGDTVSTGASIGTTLCSWMFPNLYKTPSAHDADKETGIGLSAWDKFYNREWLERIISFNYNYDYPEGVLGYPARSLMGGIRMTGSIPTNFRPMNAQAVFERFTPAGGVIWDYCSGFGGRLLGALTSKKDFTYIGTDPDTETVYNLHSLGKSIEEVTGRSNSFELHCCGSETLEGEANSIDFAFSSPPYFDLEQYGIDGGDFNSEAQCWIKFPDLDDWMNGYVRGTIRNIHHMLKRRSYYAVNIADFTTSKGSVSYVDRWRQISEEEGFRHYDTVYLGVKARTGSKMHGGQDGSVKHENIMIFKKR